MEITVTALQEYESFIRLSVFVGVFLIMALLEAWLPRKQRVLPRVHRWFTNAALVIVDSFALRLLVPILAVAAAAHFSQKGWGLFNWLELPFWVAVVLSIVLLDMLIYWQHVASHHFSILWRFHKVHHADRDIDVTTGVRFHPVEIVLSMLFKIVCVLVIGAPALAVFVFEVILNASAMFNHANFAIPKSIDAHLRKIIVTPDMHRVHHSVIPSETNSNYGFFLSFWDRLFNSYIPQPREGHHGMRIGLNEYQSQQPASLIWSLKVPFVNNKK